MRRLRFLPSRPLLPPSDRSAHHLAQNDPRKSTGTDTDDFVVRNLTDQIEAFDRVRTNMREQLEDLSSDQRHEIEDASAVLRKSRASRSLALTPLNITPIGSHDHD